MLQGVTRLFLLIVVIDSEAKADILSKLDTTPKRRFFVYPGLAGGITAKEVAGAVCGNEDFNAWAVFSELNITI